MRTRIILLIAAFGLAACSDSIPGAGTLVATVVSPNVNEGAAIVSVTGPGITGVSAASGGQVFSQAQGDGVRVVVLAEPAAVLSFLLQVDDTTADFTGQVLEVAGPTDVLRNSLVNYEVEIRR